MASDSSSDFSFSFPTRYHTFLYGHIKYNREGGRNNKQTNTDLGQLQAHSPCICRLLPACILLETSTKATRNANSSLTVIPHCLLLLTVLPLDCYLRPTVLLCSPLSNASLRVPLSTHPFFFSVTFFSSSTYGLAGDLTVRPLCGFRAKADKEIFWTAHTHPANTTNGHILSHVNKYFGQTNV